MTILVGLTMSACSGCDPSREGPRGFGVELEPFTVTQSAQVPGHYLFSGTAKFFPDANYSGVVQELRINGELVVIEYTRISSGHWARDKQTGQHGELREMVVYPADIEGCNLDANGYGMVWRTDKFLFNPDYAPPSGTITRRSTKEVRWFIDARNDFKVGVTE